MSNMANIIDSYFISSQFHQFYTCTSFCSKTNILCASAVSPSQYQLRELPTRVGRAVSWKDGNHTSNFFFFISQAKPAKCRKTFMSVHQWQCLYTRKSSNVDRFFGLVSCFLKWPTVSKLKWSFVVLEILLLYYVKKNSAIPTWILVSVLLPWIRYYSLTSPQFLHL